MKKRIMNNLLDELRKACKFERADFGENDKLIKERTLLYRDTWILPVIDEIQTLLNERRLLKE